MIKSFILLSCTAIMINAQQYGFGGCPSVPVMENLDLNKLAGKWFEFARINNTMQMLSGCGCLNLNVTDGITMTLKQSVLGVPMTQIGDMKTESPGIFTVSFRGDLNPIPMKLEVIGTDYTSYLVLHACYDMFNLMHLEKAWIMSRTAPFSLPPIFSAPYNEAALRDFDKLNISREHLQATVHVFCNYDM